MLFGALAPDQLAFGVDSEALLQIGRRDRRLDLNASTHGDPSNPALAAKLQGRRPDRKCDILSSARDRLIPDTPELSVPASRARP